MKLALIPARGGSKRIPRKNIRPFCGQPMLAWSVAAARDSGSFDRIVVSTDAHRLHELDNLELGVAQARRGWVTAEQVVNTRTWPQVKKLLKR